MDGWEEVGGVGGARGIIAVLVTQTTPSYHLRAQREAVESNLDIFSHICKGRDGGSQAVLEQWPQCSGSGIIVAGRLQSRVWRGDDDESLPEQSQLDEAGGEAGVQSCLASFFNAL